MLSVLISLKVSFRGVWSGLIEHLYWTALVEQGGYTCVFVYYTYLTEHAHPHDSQPRNEGPEHTSSSCLGITDAMESNMPRLAYTTSQRRRGSLLSPLYSSGGPLQCPI
ncbi:hypothetical protein M404DRAFT_765450 [Pisolithus tinctorius Marx 270]|uniref:Uncharacterized protein n=1 Tax=Pisolithus tinctorius Marx 270 TaxID=870435 RepID=A0A0C3ITL5_PISTI|nr:hypothetical protein M404DRAFT_765450 [Pisolithus tinctorius Marx 270]